MPIIKDAISDVLGIEPDWNWSEHLQQASFRGVPFGVISGESVFRPPPGYSRICVPRSVLDRGYGAQQPAYHHKGIPDSGQLGV